MRKFLLSIDVSCEVGTLVAMAWCKCPFSVLQKEKREAVSLGCTLERTQNDLVALGGTVLREEVQRISSRLVIRQNLLEGSCGIPSYYTVTMGTGAGSRLISY